MDPLEAVLRSLDLEFFGSGKHKMTPEQLLSEPGAVLLDVRSREEQDSIRLGLKHHISVLEIPTNEVPERISEIPSDRPVGIFCSAGTRAAIVYAYLRSKGYENVRIILGGYEALTSPLHPGPLLRHLRQR